MKYKVRLLQLASLPIGIDGIAAPLCDKCDTLDCSNPIFKKEISILGSSQRMKVYKRGDDYLFVASCEGFQPKYKEDLDEESENNEGEDNEGS